jgi:hypothetical protein
MSLGKQSDIWINFLRSMLIVHCKPEMYFSCPWYVSAVWVLWTKHYWAIWMNWYPCHHVEFTLNDILWINILSLCVSWIIWVLETRKSLSAQDLFWMSGMNKRSIRKHRHVSKAQKIRSSTAVASLWVTKGLYSTAIGATTRSHCVAGWFHKEGDPVVTRRPMIHIQICLDSFLSYGMSCTHVKVSHQPDWMEKLLSVN